MNSSAPAEKASARLSGLALDGACLLLLLASVCVLFSAAIQHPDRVPDGMDLTQHYSREAVIRWALRTTWIPLWNPFEFSGFPLQADPQTGVLYPPSMLLRLLPLPSFLTWTVIFHVWLFGVGGYVLCRTAGSRRGAALIAAIGLMMGGITIPRVYAGHLDVLRTVAWLPLALALAIRSIDRRSLLPSGGAVAALALTLLSGFLQLFCYTVLAIVLYAAFAVIWPASGRRTGRATPLVVTQVALLVLLAIGLNAFQLLPTARLVLAAGRTAGVPLHNALESSVPLRELPSAVWPRTKTAVEHQSWETSVYVGWLPTILAPLAFLDRRRRRIAAFFASLAVIAAALATGGPLYTLHHMVFPMFRVPGRLMVLWAISLAVLGAAGFDWLQEQIAHGVAGGRSRAGRIVFALLLVVAAGLVTSDAFRYARPFAGVRPLHEKFAASVPFSASRFGRVLSVCENRLFTSELTGLAIPSVDGYNSYFLSEYAALSEQARGDEPAQQRTSFHRMGELGTIADFGVLNLLDVTEMVSCAPIDAPGLELVSRWDNFFLYRNTRAIGRVAPLCVGAGGRLAFGVPGCADGVRDEILAADTASGLFRARVSIPASRVMFLSEPYYPERRAWVDGAETPIEKVSVALSAVNLGPGTHLIELRFVPTTLYVGTAISVVVAGLWLVAQRRIGERPDFSRA